MTTTKCDIIRDVATATKCGMCTALAATPPQPIPAGCFVGGNAPPTAVCGVPGAANARMKLFAAQYSVFDRADRTQEEKIYEGIIQTNDAALAAAYPGAVAPAVSWPDLELCLWDKSGARGGFNNNVYFGRNDALQLGMTPAYPVGGAFAENSIWKVGKKPSPVPLAVDYAMNPDLFAILLFALVVVIFAVLVWSARKSAKNAPYLAQQKRDAELQRLEENDPYRGTAFETYRGPNAKCRAYVEAMEHRGYDMAYYRTQCGLPAKPE